MPPSTWVLQLVVACAMRPDQERPFAARTCVLGFCVVSGMDICMRWMEEEGAAVACRAAVALVGSSYEERQRKQAVVLVSEPRSQDRGSGGGRTDKASLGLPSSNC